mmetsp:Transcript_15340/g.19653  ORF Transcript_15340/g.19653 Transcript_15340/m.19653 type:complete len:440 (+) Transcript_15340:1-1320(+)
MMRKLYQNKEKALFKNRGRLMLTISGFSNFIVTIFQFGIIIYGEHLPCNLVILGSYLMVSILHFPYILRSVQHAIMSDISLRAQHKMLTQRCVPLILLALHTIFGIGYFSIFSSGLIIKRASSSLECGFNVYDGFYMLITLMYYITVCLWSVAKIRNFEDRYNISAEIMYVYLIWAGLAVPYLVFQVFLKNIVGAACFMVIMNILLLYVSFQLPLNASGHDGHLRKHPVKLVLDVLWSSHKIMLADEDQDGITLAEAFLNEQWSLEKILQHEALQKELIELCRGFLCEENPLFLRDVLRYKQPALNFDPSRIDEKEEESNKCLSEKFMAIWSAYVSSKGHLSVNVSSKVRSRVQPKDFDSKDFQSKVCIFDECFSEIEAMLVQNLRNMLKNTSKKTVSKEKSDEDGLTGRLSGRSQRSFQKIGRQNTRMVRVSPMFCSF